MKRIFLFLGLGMLCALAAGLLIRGRGERDMKNIALATELPLIDRSVPAKLETATFALG